MSVGSKLTSCTIGTNHCSCIDKLTKEELELIESKSVYVDFKKGEIICKKGSLSSHIMMVEEGLIKVFIENGVDSLVLKIVNKGNFLGLSSLREDSNYFPYSAMAYTDTRIKQIDLHTFLTILKRNAEFSKEIIDIMATNSEQLQGRFFCLIHKQSFGRMADILLCMSDRIFGSKAFNLPISKKDLAELTGMSAETAVRILKQFQKDGLIQMDGKAIEVIDYERLSIICETG